MIKGVGERGIRLGRDRVMWLGSGGRCRVTAATVRILSREALSTAWRLHENVHRTANARLSGWPGREVACSKASHQDTLTDLRPASRKGDLDLLKERFRSASWRLLGKDHAAGLDARFSGEPNRPEPGAVQSVECAIRL